MASIVTGMKFGKNQLSRALADELLDVRETAADYNVREGTLRHWLHLKLLPSYKLGRRRLIRRSDMEAFIERHREEAQP